MNYRQANIWLTALGFDRDTRGRMLGFAQRTNLWDGYGVCITYNDTTFDIYATTA